MIKWLQEKVELEEEGKKAKQEEEAKHREMLSWFKLSIPEWCLHVKTQWVGWITVYMQRGLLL